jgi:hypothetical protein
MKKAILIGIVIIALASLFYFKKSSLDDPASTSKNTNLPSNSAEISGQKPGLNADSQLPISSHEGMNATTSSPGNSSPEAIASTPSSEKNQEWYKNFETSLSQIVTEQGFAQEVADCLLTAAKQNMNQEKPLDFEGLSDSCAAKHQLSEAQRSAHRKAFRNAVSSSHTTIDMDEWKACMMAKYKEGGCIPGLIRENVEAFYTQKSGSAPMKKDAFEQERQNEIEKILEIALKECPKDLDQLNGVYANECT